MSRNNKNARLHAEAKAVSTMHKLGNKGPAKTTALHGKVNVNWKKAETAAARKTVLTGKVVEVAYGKAAQ